jgi:hypothetical protein
MLQWSGSTALFRREELCASSSSSCAKAMRGRAGESALWRESALIRTDRHLDRRLILDRTTCTSQAKSTVVHRVMVNEHTWLDILRFYCDSTRIVFRFIRASYRCFRCNVLPQCARARRWSCGRDVRASGGRMARRRCAFTVRSSLMSFSLSPEPTPPRCAAGSAAQACCHVDRRASGEGEARGFHEEFFTRNKLPRHSKHSIP